MEYLPTPSRAGTKVLKGRTDITMTLSQPRPPLPPVRLPLPVRKNPTTSTITRSVATSASTATTASAGPSTWPITPVGQETPAIAGPSTRPLMPAIQATCGIAGPNISVLANVPIMPATQPISTSHSTGGPLFWARATQYKRKRKEHLSERVAELQERIHTLHSIREDEEFLDSVLATQTADKTVPATGKERDVSLHCRWDMLGAKPKLILASTPNPANNNSDKGWILVRGKERSSNQHNGCGKQPSSGQNILLDNRYEALASTRVEEIEQSHLNILPPSPGHQGHQAQHNLHQRNNSSLASKQ
ncbi:hypothetical protein SRHO_G00340070 [Serrasalmus rhombeus]